MSQTALPPAKFAFRKFAHTLLNACEPVFELLIRTCGWSAILFVAAIFIFVFVEAAPGLKHLNFSEFLTSSNWRPTSQVREQYGILALVVGTL
jgi:ABC-type phosphate transport system permease subunit